MPSSPRPKGLPRLIPHWGWLRLLRPAHKPQKGPHKLPSWFWVWRSWRLGEKKPKPTPAPTPTPPKPKPFTPLQGCDYESGPTAKQLKAAGIRFVCRYISTPGNAKNLTPAEAKALHDALLPIVLVFETTGTTFIGGAAAGRHDATLALEQAKALGVHSAVPIYFAIDTDPHGKEATIVSYIKGAASVLGRTRTGVYAGFSAIESCKKAGVCDWFWQTLAWSGGLWSSANHIEQISINDTIAGHSVDHDHAVKASYGAWRP